MSVPRAVLLLSLFCTPLTLLSCLGAPEQRTLLSTVDWVDSDASSKSLKVRMTEFFNRFAADVTRASEEILAKTKADAIRRQALVWRSDSISLAQEAALRPDPLAALCDSWSLTVQILDYLGEGAGKDLFGRHQGTMIAAIEASRKEAEGIASTVLVNEDLSPMKGMVAKIAEGFPIEGSLLTRRSGILEYADFTTGHGSLTNLAANMNQKVNDITRQLPMYISQLPHRIRWQIEILLGETLETIAKAVADLSTSVDRISGSVDRVSDSVEKIGVVVETLPALVRTEREIVVDLVHSERKLVLADIDRQREETLQTLTKERIAISALITSERKALLDSINEQRLATIQDLGKERSIVIQAIRDERLAVMDSINQTVTESIPQATGLIDHFFIRLLELLGLIGVVLLILRAVLARRA